MEDLGLYIHIPFCMSKCHYCDFNSYSGKENIQDQYIESLIKEIEGNLPLIKRYNLKSVYIGGGTPTYLNLKSMNKLFSYLKQLVGPGIEYSCESNPGTITQEKLLIMKDSGINRLSIGVQSLNDSILERLGRIHKARDFMDNYALARQAGFKNINVDLMFSIQGQTVEELNHTIEKMIDLKPEHISCYSLIIEEGTLFYSQFTQGLIEEMDDEVDREMYHLAVSKLKCAGYGHYEISNFAKPGYECRHNIIYWACKDYLGVGAGAHSLIDGFRFSNVRGPEEYIAAINANNPVVCDRQELSLEDRMSEYMFMGLRMMQGISAHEFKQRFHRGLSDIYGEKIEKLIQCGLLISKEGRIMLSDYGIDISNQVFVEFI